MTDKTSKSKKPAQKSAGFTDTEQAAMKARAKELKAEARAGKDKAAGESDVLAKIAEMSEPDRSIATRIHEIVKAHAPAMMPKTWYGMPAYTLDGKIVFFFQCSDKFQTRYGTLGFNDSAKLDDGDMWPTAFALKAITAAVEAKIVALVKRAVGGK
jgi:uncharacterized protein YdhG (YjbR/CyaY superfamily)